MLKNKIWKIVGIVSILAIVAKIFLYNQSAQFFADIPMLFGTGAILLKFRKQIADKIRKIPLPKIVLAVLSGIPLIMLEENVSCPPTGCVLFPPTLFVLSIFILVLSIVVIYFKIRKFYSTILIFSILGFVNEYFQGYMSGPLHSLLFTPVGFIVFLFVVVSYMYIAIIPLTIVQE